MHPFYTELIGKFIQEFEGYPGILWYPILYGILWYPMVSYGVPWYPMVSWYPVETPQAPQGFHWSSHPGVMRLHER